mmetsp:Transcript_8146/g.18902  ORF Transcript_8146/g.18902 Transcript_8146/m.18902 type:complete len:85 (+) Transcript_8146:568-822(+)
MVQGCIWLNKVTGTMQPEVIDLVSRHSNLSCYKADSAVRSSAFVGDPARVLSLEWESLSARVLSIEFDRCRHIGDMSRVTCYRT